MPHCHSLDRLGTGPTSLRGGSLSNYQIWVVHLSLANANVQVSIIHVCDRPR
jgi:hypothetical protein